jgi:hypothetical protein
MRRTTDCETVGGRPSLTPLAFFTASASFVRWPISRRSNCPNVATTCAIALACGRRGVHGAVERDQRPALLLCGRHQRREVGHRARERVELRHNERLRLAALGA